MLAIVAVACALAAAGTRLSAVAFLAAAGFAWSSGGTIAAITGWAAVSAAAGIGLGLAPRRVATATVAGMAAVAAAATQNASFVGLLWAVSTVGVVAPWLGDRTRRPWVTGVLLADLPVWAAVIITVLGPGPASWPEGIGPVAAVCLAAGAVARLLPAPVPAPASIGLRVQALAGVTVAMGAQADRADVLVVAAAGVFLLGGAVRHDNRDALQEVALVATVLAASAAGWMGDGWAWTALAGGTLIHALRLRVGTDGLVSDVAEPVVRAGWGMPWLPTVAAVAVAGSGTGAATGRAAAAATLGGLAARLVWPVPLDDRRRAAVTTGAGAVGLALMAATVIAGVAVVAEATLGSWPSAMAVALVLVAATAGIWAPWLAPATAPAPQLVAPRALGVVAPMWATVAVASGSVAVGVACWAIAWSRGYL